jgi:penicillin-binding protein 1C
MDEKQIFSKNDILIALSEPFNAHRTRLPTLAPHLAQRILKEHKQTVVRTTINPILQTRTENTVKNYQTYIQKFGISNASVIIINNKTREVLAYVGSADYWDTPSLGQNDGVKAIRSPGSALKPFVYALAYEQGWLTPRKSVLDIPTDIEGFIPENYDRKFIGKTTASNALAQSLNIPAIRIINEIGANKFRDFLITGGISTFENQKLGLSMVLGGCGIRLDELTNLYVSLASNGKYAPLKWLLNDSLIAPKAWLSPESAFLVTQSLSQLQRPDFPSSGDYSTHYSKIAWKTGTSQGRRDAWAIGYRPDYTIGVWLGNFNGDSNPYLSGSETAVPLLFQLFSLIESCNYWFSVPRDIGLRTVCSESGLLPEEFCINTVSDYYITNKSNRERCQHMKWVWVSEDNQTSYCAHCLPVSGALQRLYPNISSELVAYYEEQKVYFERVPAHSSKCNTQKSGQLLRIISPLNGTIYYLQKSRLRLRAEGSNNHSKLFWFINNKFYKASQANEDLFFEPSKGTWQIICTDDQGRKAESTIWIK